MFGISLAEFIVIAIIAMAVIPAKDWPRVFKALAQLVKFVRNIIWKITDATEEIREQVEREIPIDEIMKKANISDVFAEPVRRIKKKK
jgi:Sec-independent protein translocase protein TatA